MATADLSRKTGVIVGDDVLKLFKYAQEKNFAIPAIVRSWPARKIGKSLTLMQNVTSSSTVVASLEAARDKKAPIILQMSQGGAAYFAGKVQPTWLNLFHSPLAECYDRELQMTSNKLQSLELLPALSISDRLPPHTTSL